MREQQHANGEGNELEVSNTCSLVNTFSVSSLVRTRRCANVSRSTANEVQTSILVICEDRALRGMRSTKWTRSAYRVDFILMVPKNKVESKGG